MSELRHDVVTGRRVIVAPARAARPQEFLPPTERGGGACPFCEGHEQETPPEIIAQRLPNSQANAGGWRVRVVPNKFPALTPQGADGPRGGPLDRRAHCYGVHELIIESPRHLTLTTQMDTAAVADVLLTYRDRLRALADDGRLAFAQVFKNVGAAAGASIAHLHSQIMATDFVPAEVQAELELGRRYFDRYNRCVSCDLLEREREQAERLVAESENFTAFAPFASRSAYECWILPNRHGSDYAALSDAAAGELADVLLGILHPVEHELPLAAYNLLVRTAPLRQPPLGRFHWRIEVVPRLASWAGFELGTGIFVNAVAPEQAAKKLQSSKFPKVC